MIRNILNKIDLIVESTGLANRKPGDVFADSEGNEIRFVSVNFYPENGGKFETSEQTQQAINQVIQQLGQQPIETNWFRKQTRSFGIAQFQNEKGQPLTFIRYFDKALSPDPRGNYWDNQDGLVTYRYKGKAAVKTQSQASPQDVLTQLDNLTAGDIAQQVQAKFPNSTLSAVTQHLASGGELPFTFMRPDEMDISAFQDYFCELLQPIALQTGQVEGEAQQAGETFLGNDGYTNTTINFSANKTEGLSDSIMIAPDGRSIKVSSKGGNGAAASAVNILNSYRELQETPAGRKLTKKLSNTVEILEIIAQNTMAEGPLLLAQKFDIIDANEADYVRSLKGQQLIALGQFVKNKKVPAKIREFAKNRNTKDPDNVNMYFHVMASIAFEVADHVNNNTKFDKDASIILNNSALVQVYTKVSARGQQWTLQKFSSKWPGSLISAIALNPDKSYYSTGIKQKFTFTVNPSKKQIDDPQSAHPDISAPDVEFKRSKIKAAPQGPMGTEKSLGRKRRG
jgi:hypothetical protein